MAIWRPTIFTHLFLVFSAIVLVAIGLFSAVNYVSVNDKLSSQAVHSLVSLSRSLVVNVDGQIQNMDRVSMAPIFSEPLRRAMKSAWSDPEAASEAIKLVASVNGQIQGIRQVNLYNLGGQMLGVGAPEGRQKVDVRQKTWFPAVVTAGGDRIISGPNGDPLIASLFLLDRDRRYVSLCRLFTDSETGVPGVIEVEQDCATLFQELDIIGTDQQNGRRFVILGDHGDLVYPYSKNLADLDWIKAGLPQDKSVQVITSRHPETGRNYVLAYSHSLEADWSLVIVQDEERLYADVPAYTREIFFYALLVIVLALVASYWTARQVSVPLHKLSSQMARFSLTSGPEKDVAAVRTGSGLSELDDLSRAFGQLQTELRQSFAEAVLLRAHKHRAQLLALQSQMHPHFMFNMLATVSVMAEENLAADIPAIVDDLAEMMRSIASSQEAGHTLADEFDFVRRYLRCMKHRFRDDLSFSAECPPELAGIEVPRLILQPFIENAIKHSTRQRPPWNLVVTGGREDHSWWVTIEDNGPGFDADGLADLRAELLRIRSLAPDLADLPDLHIEGMGLINTFVRLRLSYGERVIFEPGNRPDGGARVLIGGPVDEL